MMNRLVFIVIVFVVGVGFGMAACGENDDADEAGQAADELLPELDGYLTVRETDLTAAFRAANMVIPTGLSTGMVIMLDEFGSCAERRGVFASQVYINLSRPDVAGIVAVVNTTRLSSVDVLLDCMQPDSPFFSDDGIVIEPCADGWQYNDGEATYWIAYAGSSPTLCSAFDEQLPRQ